MFMRIIRWVLLEHSLDCYPDNAAKELETVLKDSGWHAVR